VRFNTNLKTDRAFYTDNGLEIRERHSEGSRTENQYYPNLSFSYLQDVNQGIQFTILSRQAMGTHSRDNGVIEQMVHRALAQDDGRGLGEPNNDQSRIEVVVYLLVQPMEPSVKMGRRLALALQHQPRLLHAEAKGGPKAWVAKYKPYYYPLVSQFPHNVHLLSFKARDSITDDIIFRVAHIFEVGQHSTYSQPKEVEWDRIFQEFRFDSKRERSLAMSLDMPSAQKRKSTVFLPSADLLKHASGVPPTFVKQDNQNTEEEGVFISQAALEDKKKQEEAAKATPNPKHRVGRQLQEFTPFNEGLIFLEPMQIKSYFVQLVPRTAKPQVKPERPTVVIPADTGKGKNGNQQNTPPKVGTSPTNVETSALSEADDVSSPVFVDPKTSTSTPNAEVSEGELRAFFGISIIGTGLVVLAYMRLRNRQRERGLLNNGGKPAPIKRVKGLIEV